MNTKITLIEVEPIGAQYSQTGAAVTNWSVYPESKFGAHLMKDRKTAGLGLKTLAGLLGIQPIELSGLEHGYLTLTADDRNYVLDVITENAQEVSEEENC